MEAACVVVFFCLRWRRDGQFMFIYSFSSFFSFHQQIMTSANIPANSLPPFRGCDFYFDSISLLLLLLLADLISDNIFPLAMQGRRKKKYFQNAPIEFHDERRFIIILLLVSVNRIQIGRIDGSFYDHHHCWWNFALAAPSKPNVSLLYSEPKILRRENA